jgi:hypothetical protein
MFSCYFEDWIWLSLPVTINMINTIMMYKHFNSRQNNGIYIIVIVTGKLNQIQSSKKQENLINFL